MKESERGKNRRVGFLRPVRTTIVSMSSVDLNGFFCAKTKMLQLLLNAEAGVSVGPVGPNFKGLWTHIFGITLWEELFIQWTN